MTAMTQSTSRAFSSTYICLTINAQTDTTSEKRPSSPLPPFAVLHFPSVNFRFQSRRSSSSGCLSPFPPVKLPGGFLVSGWQGGAASWRCSFGEASWQAWQPVPTGLLSCDSRLPAGSLKHSFIHPYKWSDGLFFALIIFFFFLANLHTTARQRRTALPPLSQTDFLNRLWRLTLLAPSFWAFNAPALYELIHAGYNFYSFTISQLPSLWKRQNVRLSALRTVA